MGVSLRRVLYFRPDNLLHDFSNVEFIKIEIRISDRNLFGCSLNRLSELFVIKNRENGFARASGRRVNVQRGVTWIYIWSLARQKKINTAWRGRTQSGLLWEKSLHETLYERNTESTGHPMYLIKHLIMSDMRRGRNKNGKNLSRCATI